MIENNIMDLFMEDQDAINKLTEVMADEYKQQVDKKTIEKQERTERPSERDQFPEQNAPWADRERTEAGIWRRGLRRCYGHV